MTKTLINIAKISVIVLTVIYIIHLILHFFSITFQVYGIYLFYYIALLIFFICIPNYDKFIFNKN